MSTINFFDTYVNITPSGTTGWQDKDLSAYVPTTALCFIRWSASSYSKIVGMRINGSAVDMSISTSSVKQCHGAVFCDASSIIELYRNHADVSYFLTGYVTADIAYKSTEESFLYATTGWTTKTASNIQDNSELAILTMLAGATTYDRGMNYRAVGSTDARQPSDNVSFTSPLLTVDASKQFQIYQEVGNSITTYCHGNISDGMGLGKTNGLDVSLGSTGAYVDIDLSSDMPANAKAAIIEVYSSTVAEYSFDLRKNGTSATHYHAGDYWPHWVVVGLDANGVIEGKISNTNVKFYVWGYLIEPQIQFYEKRLLNDVQVTKELTDIFYGIVEPHEVTLEFDNADGMFSTLLAGGEEFRGKGVKLRIYEPLESTPISFLLYGKITEFDILSTAKFTLSVYDPEPLNTIIPKKVYETTDYTDNPPNIVNPADDLGKPYNIIFGHAKKVPCRYVHANLDSDYYDYIIGYGTLNALDYVYRDKKLVDPAEYTFYDGSGAPYIGYACIRFVVPQRDLSGRYYEITADVKGLELSSSSAERNFARCIQYLLSNLTWGLGLTVNTASFDTAATEVAELYCDGAIIEQRKAIDYLNELLLLCRGKLDYNESGELEIMIDSYTAKVSCAFGHKDTTDRYENVIDILENRKTPVNEAMKSFELNYGFNYWESTYNYKNKRSIFSFGEERSVETIFVRDHVTADKITSYQKNLQVECDSKLTVKVGMEARNLSEGDITRIIYPDLSIDGNYQIRRIDRGLNEFKLTLNSYSADIYQYLTGIMPDDAADDTEPDYTNTAPSAPTAFSKTGQGTYQGTTAADGTTQAYMTFQATPPSVNYVKLIFGYRKTGETAYTYTEGQSSGSVWIARIDGLVPGLYYDFVAIAENSYSIRSTSNPTLSSQLAPGDTTAPSAPTGLTATAGVGIVTLTWTQNTEKDLHHYEVERGGSKIADVTTTKFTDSNLTYGTSYTYTIRAVDNTGNRSSASSSASATPRRTETNDIRDGHVTNDKILTCAWAKITDAYITNAQIENLNAEKINAGVISSCVLKIATGSTCNSSYGGDIYGNRTGLAHFYTTSGSEIMRMGYALDGATYHAINILGYLSGGVLCKGIEAGVTAWQTWASGTISNHGVYGYAAGSNAVGVRGVGYGYGGYFDGLKGPIMLYPSSSASAPTHAALQGTLWVTSAGVLYINIDSFTTWSKVGGQ